MAILSIFMCRSLHARYLVAFCLLVPGALTTSQAQVSTPRQARLDFQTSRLPSAGAGSTKERQRHAPQGMASEDTPYPLLTITTTFGKPFTDALVVAATEINETHQLSLKGAAFLALRNMEPPTSALRDAQVEPASTSVHSTDDVHAEQVQKVSPLNWPQQAVAARTVTATPVGSTTANKANKGNKANGDMAVLAQARPAPVPPLVTQGVVIEVLPPSEDKDPTTPPMLSFRAGVNSRLVRVRGFVDQVLARHPELYEAEAGSRAAESRERASVAGYQPQPTLGSSLGAERQSINETQRSLSYKQRQLRLGANQVLYDPALAAQIELNRAQSIGADWQLTGVREQLMARTLELYNELLRHESLTTLARENLNNHRRYVGQIKEIARSDLGRSADLPAANARVALAESVLISRIARLDAARVQWTQLSGLPSPVLNDATIDAQQLPAPELSIHVDNLVARALETNPALFKARADIDAAKQNAKLISAGFQPKISVEMNLRGGHDYASIGGGQRSAYVGLNLDWKLPLNGVRQHQDRAAQEAVVAAQYAKEKLQQDLTARVQSQWYELLAAEASLKSFDAYVVSAHDMVQAYQAQFKIGRRSLLDLLNAENELFTARSNASTTRYDITLNAWRLSALAGNLREELGV